MSKSANVWGSECLCVFLSVCKWGLLARGPNLTWHSDFLCLLENHWGLDYRWKKKKKRQKINLTAFIPLFMWHLIYFTNTFFCVKGTIELTWGLDAGWRRGAGLWTVWFGCCGRQSKPFRWRCSVSPIQEVKDPVPHSSHYSDLWNVTDMQTTCSTALLQRKNKGNVGWDEGKETQSTHIKLEV